MDFEILNTPEAPAGPLEMLRRYLLNPHRQMQTWAEKTPLALGAFVLLGVAVELVVGKRVLSGAGAGLTLIGQIAAVGGMIVFCELFLLTAASSVATVTEKAHRPMVALCYMNLALTPLLLWLPMALAARAMDWSASIPVFAFLFLAFRVASGWKNALQFTYRLSRLQTVIAFYGAGSAATALIVVFLYIAIFGQVMSLIGG